MSSRFGRRARRHFSLTAAKPFKPMKGGAPAGPFAGAVPPALRRSAAGASQRTASNASEQVCSCASPLVPGWPDATVTIACISAAGFWQTVSRPCVFRLVSIDGNSPEEAASIAAGYFIFLVRPGLEDADTKALAQVLKAQGGPIMGKPVDFSDAGKVRMQIVAVLRDQTDESDLIDGKGGPAGE